MQFQIRPFAEAKELLEKRLNRRVLHLTKSNYQIIASDMNEAFDKAGKGEDIKGCYEKTKNTTLYNKDSGAYCELLSIMCAYKGG